MENFDKINNYLKGEMPDKERTDFEKEVASNEDLAREIATQKFEEYFFEFAAKEDISQQIKKVQAEIPFPTNKEKSGIFAINKWWVQAAIAASFLLLLVTYLYQKEQYSTENILCLLYTSPSPRDLSTSRMPSSA